jgi:ABC-type glycerol-3-phosphate transport system substrate-binding protein
VKASLATVAIALLVLSACGGDDSGGSTADDGGTETTAASADLTSYETVSDLNDALAAAGVQCELEYEGLVDEIRELSQCTIDGGQAILTIWYDDDLMNEFLAPEGADPPAAVAYGEDWTVELTDPATAATVAEAAGGTTTDA